MPVNCPTQVYHKFDEKFQDLLIVFHFVEDKQNRFEQRLQHLLQELTQTQIKHKIITRTSILSAPKTCQKNQTKIAGCSATSAKCSDHIHRKTTAIFFLILAPFFVCLGQMRELNKRLKHLRTRHNRQQLSSKTESQNSNKNSKNENFKFFF